MSEVVQFFLDEIADDDLNIVARALQKLDIIGLEIGESLILSKLVPALTEYVKSGGDDYTRVIICEQLRLFPELVQAKNLLAFLPLLEFCLKWNDLHVRKSAVDTLSEWIPLLKRSDIVSKILPLINSLGNADIFFERTSCCELIPTVYMLFSSDKQENFRKMLATLCKDETPMVRRTACIQLLKIAPQVKKDVAVKEVLPVVDTLRSDYLDRVRLHALKVLFACCSHMDDEKEWDAVILPRLRAWVDDESWRVRQCVAENIVSIVANSPRKVSGELMKMLSNLLRDNEPKVRSKALKAVPGVYGEVKISSSTTSAVLPLLPDLAKDEQTEVRTALASVICHLFALFGKDAATKHLMPLVKLLAKDDESEVRDALVKDLQTVHKVISRDAYVSGIVPLMLDAARDTRWRCRYHVISQSLTLCKVIGVKKFEKTFQNTLLTALTDHVCLIRRKACEQIGLVVKEFGEKWAADKFLPWAMHMYRKSSNSLHRLSSLIVAGNVVGYVSVGTFEKLLLPTLLKATQDDVANVRIVAARTAKVVAPFLKGSKGARELSEQIEKLKRDRDSDVVFYARQVQF